ncbi:ATP synthase F0 subunit B [Limisalsivibrio acetivorans]|uniref:F0F1 ATP synthase subunit B family protein n=1 Tax=Limisalsivibrio acetivorans TaxID=1304888 RepID=UPI0003B7B93E|nr:ATP synthase F0 subunit B [Limisalsivibrio acetivorans]
MKRTFLILALLLVMTTGAAFAATGGDSHAVDWGALWANFFQRLLVFAIFAGVLIYLLKKPLLNYLDKRSEEVEKSIKDAEEASENARTEITNYEIKMKGYEADLEKMKQNALQTAEAEKKEILEDAEKQISKMQELAEKRIDSDIKKASQEIRKDAVLAALEAAQAKIGKELSAAKQKEILDSYIKKIEVSN